MELQNYSNEPEKQFPAPHSDKGKLEEQIPISKPAPKLLCEVGAGMQESLGLQLRAGCGVLGACWPPLPPLALALNCDKATLLGHSAGWVKV